MKIKSILITTILPFNFLQFLSLPSPSATNRTKPHHSETQPCSDQQQLRQCIQTDKFQEGGFPVTLFLCQDKNKVEIGNMILIEKSIHGTSDPLNITGTITIDKHRNINFTSQQDSPRYSILFTNDVDEAYMTISKNNEAAETHTLYCE